MARPLRLEFPGAVYHLTARGNARQAVVADADDRRRYVALLGRGVSQQRWAWYAWCLMDSHYHLVIETPAVNLITGMRRLNRMYTQSFNRRHGRVGHLSQGRCKSLVVDKESYLLELCRYVVPNPVRAGMVRSARDWRWSGYRATAGLVKAPDWLAADWVLGHFGLDVQRAQLADRQFVLQGVKEASPWDSLRGQIWLGGEAFREQMALRVAGENPEAVPEAHTRPERATPQDVLGAVAAAFGIEANRVLSRTHRAAFQAAVFLLRRVCSPVLEGGLRSGWSFPLARLEDSG